MPDQQAEAGTLAPLPATNGEGPAKLLFDIDGIDLSRYALDRTALERFIPHRGVMMLLDGVVWESEDHTRAIGVKHVRDDEFWVPGHFPEKAMFPGVLMVETAAQLACYLYNVRKPYPVLAAFLRIEDAVFRNSVVPGDSLYILCSEIKWSNRRFISEAQGIVGDRIAFEAKISGLSLGDARLGDPM